jgi:hypothetical protein
MPDFSTFDGFRDTLVGMLAAGVISLIALVRRLDVGEINRRLDRLEALVDQLRLRGDTTDGN